MRTYIEDDLDSAVGLADQVVGRGLLLGRESGDVRDGRIQLVHHADQLHLLRLQLHLRHRMIR